MNKYFILPEKFKLSLLNKPSKTYFGYKDLTQVKFVDRPSVHNENLAIDFRDLLLNKNQEISCSLQLKKNIESHIPAKLTSGKKAKKNCIYALIDPGAKAGTNYKEMQIKWIISGYSGRTMHHLDNSQRTLWDQDNRKTINYLREQIDNFVLDEDDYIIVPTNNRARTPIARTIWTHYIECDESLHKEMILYHQEPIHFKNVMDVMPEGSRFTEERFKTMSSWAKTSNDKDNFNLILTMIAGFDLSKSKDVLMVLLMRNYLFVFKKRLQKQGFGVSCTNVPLNNYYYYTSRDAYISNYGTIDGLLYDYEKIIRQRTSNFKVSKEDLQLISKYFYIPVLDQSRTFEIKIQPKQFA